MVDNGNISMKELMLLQWPYGPEIALGAFTLITATKASDACQGKHMYWTESLLYSILLSFGGNILAQFLIGVPPVVFTNDLALIFGVASWFILWQIRPFVKGCYDLIGVKQLLVFLAELTRFRSITAMVTIANAVIQGHVSGQYAPPLWGPVLLGTISGCGGLFLPFDKGLSALKDGAPYALQSAFFCSLLYHLVVFYPTIQSRVVGYVGSYDNGAAEAIILGIFVTKSVILSTADWFYTPPQSSSSKRKIQ
eukprot:439384_1